MSSLKLIDLGFRKDRHAVPAFVSQADDVLAGLFHCCFKRVDRDPATIITFAISASYTYRKGKSTRDASYLTTNGNWAYDPFDFL